jgi:hypothetical protein
MGPRDDQDGCGKSRSHGIRSPDRPARSESLYLLRYRGAFEIAVPQQFTGNELTSSKSAGLSRDINLFNLT